MLKFAIGDKVIVNKRAGAAWAGEKGTVKYIELKCEMPNGETRAAYGISGISGLVFYSYELDLVKKAKSNGGK
jgi:hypothetical protein